MSDTITLYKSPEQLLRDDIERQTLEAAAKLLEKRSGNPLYERAWKIGAKLIRAMKDERDTILTKHITTSAGE